MVTDDRAAFWRCRAGPSRTSACDAGGGLSRTPRQVGGHRFTVCVATATPRDLPVIIERAAAWSWTASAKQVTQFPVHPTAFYAARPRWGASGATSDAGDSYKLTDYLR